MESADAIENNEQVYQAELLRERARARAAEAAAEAEAEEEAALANTDMATRRQSRINPVTGAFWIGFSFIIDLIQFAATASIAIPIIGWVTGPLAYVLGWIVSIFMVLIYIFWFLWIGISISSKDGVVLYGALFAAALGESVLGFLPVWTGFAIWAAFKLTRSRPLQHIGTSK